MIVRTVLGDIAPTALGPCDAHEQLFLDAGKGVEAARTPAAAGASSLVAEAVARSNDEQRWVEVTV
jgi:predicted metal-dependent phosphotriesterase family hydrolase